MVEQVVEEPKAATPQETPPEEPKAEATVAEQSVDWKARAEKAEQDLRSVRGTREREADIRDHLAALRDEMKYLAEHQELMQTEMATALGMNEKDSAVGQLKERHQAEASALEKQRQAERQTEASKAGYAGWLKGQYARLKEANFDDDGNLMLDLNTAPELAEPRQKWISGVTGFEREPVRDALFEAETILKRVKREKKKAARKAVPAKPSEEEESDLDTGPGAGSPGRVSDEEIDRKWLEHDRKYPDRDNPYDGQYRALLNRR